MTALFIAFVLPAFAAVLYPLIMWNDAREYRARLAAEAREREARGEGPPSSAPPRGSHA